MFQFLKKGHYSTECSAPRKNDHENSNMVFKADFKNLFQSSLKDMLTKKENHAKKKDNMGVDDESLDMNVFEKLMEGKQIGFQKSISIFIERHVDQKGKSCKKERQHERR
jgi:hypothetical protein